MKIELSTLPQWSDTEDRVKKLYASTKHAFPGVDVELIISDWRGKKYTLVEKQEVIYRLVEVIQ